jgi:lipopolysaccharide/colanic/teichoic acid biosynthesis glycosyltransferase
MARGSRSARADRSAPLARAHWNAGERICALGLLVIGAPVIALIALFIRVTTGRPVFYRGERLGRGRRSFTMYKLRTLREGAQKVTGSELLGDKHDLIIRGGRFLRETRLDELPQLWNIVRGDMSFVGPRPERPEVFQDKCCGIPGYERRFAVRPGLIGVSQLFTPHGTPKCYRALIDNGVIRREAHGEQRLRIVAFTVWVVAREVARRVARHLAVLRARLGDRYREKRCLRRVAPEGAVVRLECPGEAVVHGRLVDINSEWLVVECAWKSGFDRITEFELDVPVRGRTRPGRRLARCTGRVIERRGPSARVRLLIRYQPASPRSEYMIHQYFLRNSLAVAPRVWPGAPTPVLPAFHASGSALVRLVDPPSDEILPDLPDPQAVPVDTGETAEPRQRVRLG